MVEFGISILFSTLYVHFRKIQYFFKAMKTCFTISGVARLSAARGWPPEMITIRFTGWISGRIVSLQPDTDIQKLLSDGNRMRISETILLIFRRFRLLEKAAHWTIIHLLSSEASFQPSVPWLPVYLWCNLCTVVQSHSPSWSANNWTLHFCQPESVPGVTWYGSFNGH